MLGSKNLNFTVRAVSTAHHEPNCYPQAPVLPVGRLRAPFEVAWPAVVGYDHVWRHAIFGTRLAFERPVSEAEARRRTSAAQTMI